MGVTSNAALVSDMPVLCGMSLSDMQATSSRPACIRVHGHLAMTDKLETLVGQTARQIG